MTMARPSISDLDPTMVAMAASVMHGHGKYGNADPGQIVQLAKLSENPETYRQMMEKKPEAYWQKKMIDAERDLNSNPNAPARETDAPLGPSNENVPGNKGPLGQWNKRT